jgi:argininosuccinate synthase
MKILAPIREWSMTREEEIVYAKAKGIAVSTASTKYSIDACFGVEPSNVACWRMQTKNHPKMFTNGLLVQKKRPTNLKF